MSGFFWPRMFLVKKMEKKILTKRIVGKKNWVIGPPHYLPLPGHTFVDQGHHVLRLLSYGATEERNPATDTAPTLPPASVY